MPVDLTFYAFAAFVVLLSGVSKTGFGAGVEMLAVPALAIFIAPQQGAAIMLPILVMMDLANFWRYRHDWVKRILLLVLPGALIGIVIGSLTFKYLDGDMIRLGIGLLALFFVAQRYLTFYADRQLGTLNRGWIALLGTMAGFTSFVAHAGSPPMKMVLLSQNLTKQQFVGTNSYVFGSINFLKLFPYFYLGQFSVENLTISASLVPFVIVGIALGFWMHSRVSQVVFTRVIFAALFFAGVKLTYDGVVAFL